MKRRWPLTLLAAFLFLWEPSRVARELLMALSTLGMRGWAAIVELIAHAVVAALAVAAARSLWNGAHHAYVLAIAALGGSALVTIQSLYWSALPQQTAPGEPLPYATLAVVHATAWIGYLLARHRVTSA